MSTKDIIPSSWLFWIHGTWIKSEGKKFSKTTLFNLLVVKCIIRVQIGYKEPLDFRIASLMIFSSK
jgi:hypothetical protein